VLTTYVPVRLEIERQKRPNPIMRLLQVETVPQEDGSNLVTFLVSNRSTSTLSLWMDRLHYERRYADKDASGKVVRSQQSGDPRLLVVGPGESAWFIAELRDRKRGQLCDSVKADFTDNAWNRTDEFSGKLDGGWTRWVWGDLRYPTPSETRGRLCMEMFNKRGERTPAIAFF
jgi:hypothetical protein